MKNTKQVLILSVLAAAFTVACAAGGNSNELSSAELDALTADIVAKDFHDKGIVKVEEAFATDETIIACNAADVAGKPLSDDEARRLEALNMATVKWPSDGRYLGDWELGEKIAQSGRGKTWTDKADTVNGGNCYNCHQINKEELSFGTIGTSLYNYGKIRGVTDPNADDANTKQWLEYTWAKIWNSKASNACSNMPRAGHKGILSEDDIRHLMALLLDPNSPVNSD